MQYFNARHCYVVHLIGNLLAFSPVFVLVTTVPTAAKKWIGSDKARVMGRQLTLLIEVGRVSHGWRRRRMVGNNVRGQYDNAERKAGYVAGVPGWNPRVAWLKNKFPLQDERPMNHGNLVVMDYASGAYAEFPVVDYAKCPVVISGNRVLLTHDYRAGVPRYSVDMYTLDPASLAPLETKALDYLPAHPRYLEMSGDLVATVTCPDNDSSLNSQVCVLQVHNVVSQQVVRAENLPYATAANIAGLAIDGNDVAVRTARQGKGTPGEILIFQVTNQNPPFSVAITGSLAGSGMSTFAISNGTLAWLETSTDGGYHKVKVTNFRASPTAPPRLVAAARFISYPLIQTGRLISIYGPHLLWHDLLIIQYQNLLDSTGKIAVAASNPQITCAPVSIGVTGLPFSPKAGADGFTYGYDDYCQVPGDSSRQLQDVYLATYPR